MAACIEVWDPSSEGPWIVEGLRQEGFEARQIDIADVVLTRADLVVMAGDAEGALAALKLLRDDGLHGDVPVVLIGVPDGIVHAGEGPAFGADAVVLRPVAFEALLRCVHKLLGQLPAEVSQVARPKVEHTMRISGEESEPDSSQVFVVRAPAQSGIGAWPLREPTLQLSDAVLPNEEDTPARARSAVTPSRGDKRERTGTGSRSYVERTPEPVLAPEERAKLSPWLEELMRSADRRVFPDLPPLVLHFPAADEPPDVLVPLELLEAPSLRIDEPVHEDPIDAFTYVGGPAVPPPIRESSVPGVELPPSRSLTEASESRQDSVVTATGDGEPASPPPRLEYFVREVESAVDAPRGTLERGDLARLLARIARGGDAVVEIEGAMRARFTFVGGELARLEGDVARAALASLRRRGRANESPADEQGALDALERKVERGEVSRFERDRLLREAREDLLERLLVSDRVSYSLRAADPSDRARAPTRALSRAFSSALVEAARRAFRDDDVRRIVGVRGIALGKGREAALVSAGLASELVELFVAMEGCTLSEILAAAPTEPGLAGVIYALIASEALVLAAAPDRARVAPEASSAARELLEAAAANAEDGDYFTILGVGREAAGAEIERAHAARRGELEALPLGLLGLSALADARDDAIEALDEARRALEDDARRAAYRAALAR